MRTAHPIHPSPPRSLAFANRRSLRGLGGPGGLVGRAFSLIELLVVIGIIGIIAGTAVPAIRSLTQSNTIASGSRQILDELALARQLAISGRRTVYLLFVPTNVVSHVPLVKNAPLLTTAERDQQVRLLTEVLAKNRHLGYALFTRRTVGDQPGQSSPRYLSDWKTLPDGIVFPTRDFVDLGNNWLATANQLTVTNRPLPYAEFPFPQANSPGMRLPYIAFDSQGRVTYEPGQRPAIPDVAVALSRGSVFQGPGGAGAPVDLVETPPGNRLDILVSAMTGRARVQQMELR